MSAPQSPPSPQKFVRCPGCREQLGVRPEDAGRRAKCSKCGKVFLIGGGSSDVTVPANSSASPIGPVAPLPPEPNVPEFVTFECSLCQTRMSARIADVGRMAACPDCGRRNKIPPPPKPKQVKPPAALSGEQYDLWGVDETPWLGAANEPKLIPVECRLCQTLMYATEAQEGAEMKCPDCGALTKIVRPKPKRPGSIVPVLPSDDYDLDLESAPTPRHTPIPVSLRDAELHEHARATTVGPDGRLIVQKRDDYKRPERPAVPLIQGVWRMLFTQEVIARWIMMSISFGFAAWFLYSALFPAMGSVAQGIMAIFMAAIGAGLSVVWLTFAAPSCLTIVGESAEGHDVIHDAPTWSPLEWMGESMQLATSLAAAGLAGALPSWGLAWAFQQASVPLRPEVVAGIGAVGPLLVFPLALLGTMLENTALGVISPRLLVTLVRCPGPWLLFYAESAILATATGGALYGVSLGGTAGVIAAPLITMGAMVVYMRLLGRLAWWISDATAVEEDDQFVDEAEAAHPHLAEERRAERERRKLAAAEEKQRAGFSSERPQRKDQRK
jgi:DNA-directed RNA polymerase subunit M/transcription elongation factor TFIIS